MLNKRALRKFSTDNPAPAIPPNNGLLHAQQVDFIIRTDVRIIDHHRTLVLYIYDRKKAVDGDSTPAWTMFQASDDYTTLVRRPDGTLCWRKAAFERLETDYRFTAKCAFYSSKDEQRVSDFFHDRDHDGMVALLLAQSRILDQRQRKREQQRDRAVRAKMREVPALPRNLVTWAHRNVMPAYFIYDHAKGGKATGICSSCGHKATFTGVKHNDKGVCPHCGRPLIMKPRGRIGRLYDRETAQVIQRAKDGELVVRIIKASCAYSGENPGTLIYENARQFVRLNQDGTIQCDNYYYSYGDAKWKHGTRPGLYPYQYHYEADTCGHVYCDNLPKALYGTPWQYCPVKPFYEHFREPMELYSFLAAYIRHPKLEHLVKVGFYNLASDTAYRGSCGMKLDESQNRTHRLLCVGAEDVDFLRKLDVEQSALKIFQGYCERNLKDRQRLLTWQLENKVDHNVDLALDYMTAHRFIRYMDTQWVFLRLRLTQYKSQRYRSMQDIVSEYRDYLDMCVKLGYDMDNSFILFPKDLQKAHDRTAHRSKLKADAQLRRDFKTAMQAISKHLDFELDGMRILIPSTPEEIVAEGQALHHCVGNYVDRVARRESIILFLRQSDNVDKSFYTIEVKNRKAVQVRGMRNCPATPEVQSFVDRYERQVLMAA